MTITYRSSTIEDAAEITPNLRASDVEELTRSYGPNLEECIRKSIKGSDSVESAMSDGKVVAILGIYAGGEGIGIPWMVSTDASRKFIRNILQDAKAHVLEWEKKYPIQLNMVYAENKITIRWLKAIGYTIGPLNPKWGYAQAPFYQFYRIRKENNV